MDESVDFAAASAIQTKKSINKYGDLWMSKRIIILMLY